MNLAQVIINFFSEKGKELGLSLKTDCRLPLDGKGQDLGFILPGTNEIFQNCYGLNIGSYQVENGFFVAIQDDGIGIYTHFGIVNVGKILGQLLGLIGFSEDMKLVNRRPLFDRSLIRHLQNPFVAFSLATGKIVCANQGFADYFGKTLPEIIGSAFSEYLLEPEKANELHGELFTSVGINKPFFMSLSRCTPPSPPHFPYAGTEFLPDYMVFKHERSRLAGKPEVIESLVQYINQNFPDYQAINANYQDPGYIIEIYITPLSASTQPHLKSEGRYIPQAETRQQWLALTMRYLEEVKKKKP
ncbi:MAG: hypothetical protein NTW06_00820 [Candidatus Falkowbacteria bacterium]|nr:hypothetical protein [Candidatus Falkowbacteria bacterium]